MILKNPNSKYGIVNLFSDFILSKIPKNEKTIIQVIDVINFVVIKGKTSYKEILDITKIKEEFIEKFPQIEIGYKLKNTIDLIEYDCKMKDITSFDFVFFKNDENCSFSGKQIKNFIADPNKSYSLHFNSPYGFGDDKLYYASEFPHGYSMDQGRSLFYYGKKIFYTISPQITSEFLFLTISTEKDDNNDFKFLVKNEDDVIDQKLTSSVLDCFDFEITDVEISEDDWFNEILNPIQDHQKLKEINKNFILF
jgi:hypothetical protein